jgi:23S rRNA (cytidine2498-2'-O)-methyltransferase
MSVLIYCRPGYEKDAAQELSLAASLQHWPAYCKTWAGLGFCELIWTQDSPPTDLDLRMDQLIFPRQWLHHAELLTELPENDRIGPILSHLHRLLPDGRFQEFVIEHPDTNEGRQLARFCKKFAGALQQQLKRDNRFHKQAADQDLPRLHLCFLDYERCFIGLRYHEHPHWPMGIPRLKSPADAPSRSLLKLEEAFLRLLTPAERQALDQQPQQKTAVDLGAAPGGWTSALLNRQYWVTAVDNGPMAPQLLATGLLDHQQTDAFKFEPKQPVQLMVCDMVEKPSRVSRLIEHWLRQKWCNLAIFNLKLPMKQKNQELQSALAPLQQLGLPLLRARHLYHNRDEITVLASRIPLRGRHVPK